ncbi:MAG: hypothetical protein RMI94_07430 [Bryobacterales bacterium]|nr:hypothetical protein [Bryobacteraceae bacterium]MDW8130365.1 hypothetical protein [Bryobacterales bacterium]
MFGWLRRWRGEVPLRGAPPVRRLKCYSAASGYVYEYFYEGHRPARRGTQQGAQYVFSVSADRKQFFPVSVFISERSLELFASKHGREVTGVERYAVAKMSLFQAFDERPSPGAMREEIHVGPADVEAIFERLGLT